MLILIHNFYASSSGLGGGGLGLKTAWAWIRFNPCYALFNITAVWFSWSERLSVQCTYPPLIDPATLVRAKLQVPASALLLNHPAPLRFLKFIISLPPPQNHTWARTTAWSRLKASGYAKGRIVWPVKVPLRRNLSNIGWKPLGPAHRPVERENRYFSYIFRIELLKG
jgi:hypothetical protein